jgi:CRISPR-associated endonuclease/helicase Cas3
MSEPLAHSARYGAPAQTYRDHITNVVSGAVSRAKKMLNHYSPRAGGLDQSDLLNIVKESSRFHDLGKLDPAFQETLRRNCKSKYHIRHEDAGVAWLLKNGSDEAAGLVSAHHQGLVRYKQEVQIDRPVSTGRLDGSVFRIDDELTRIATDQSTESYLNDHEANFGPRSVDGEAGRIDGLTRRLLLSCLVDSDHSDTANHYGNENHVERSLPRWTERLERLDTFVENLPKPDKRTACMEETERQKIRDELYRTCRNADPEIRLRSCDAVVGSGKTTALMAHLLNVAATRNLRHVIVVLPYTNIIKQSVDVFRKALCLEGENPEEIVAEHHHQSDFKSHDIRHLTTLWQAPIIVTTAVQFFETLSSNSTSQLRKLHELPGSAVCLDEAHAMLPADLWPVCWNWLVEWTKRWNGHLILASGSLPTFWKLDEFRSICQGSDSSKPPRGNPPKVESISPGLRMRSEIAEHRRVKFVSEPNPLTGNQLIDLIEKAPGPRIVVVNTVQSAAVLASMIRDRNKMKVLHLTTALAPSHRAIIIDRIKAMLRHQTNWVLVATSLVEGGLDFSFCSGFRQRATAASMIQLGGRVNRNANRGENCTVLDFDFSDPLFPDNPSLRVSKAALGELFANGSISPDRPCDLTAICLAAMEAEFQPKSQESALKKVRLESCDTNYPKVALECRVIQTETHTVVVDQEMIKRLLRFEKVSSLEVMKVSVQMYPHKILKLGIEPLRSDSDLFRLPESWNYDPDFLGYMADFLDQINAGIPSGYFI